MKLLRSVVLLLVLTVVGSSALLLSGCKREAETAQTQASSKEKTLYTCGMHPQIIQDKPGDCPICGMKLTPIRKQPSGAQATASSQRKIKFYKSTMNPGETSPNPGKDSMGMDMVPVYEDQSTDSNAITIDPVTVQNMGLRTGLVTNGPVHRVIRTVGNIDFDETTLTDVTTKYRGWIEKLYVDTTGQQVHRGDPLFEIYAPELYSAQTEYLLALKTTGTGAGDLKTIARNKLKFFDISDEQIAELEKTRQVKKTLQILAPRDGIVVEKMAVQGEMVEMGMKLYRLADLTTVWVQSQIFEQDLPYVSLGQEATVSLSYMPDRKFRGRVTYIYPTVDEKTRTARVRMEFHNPGYFLKPGMFATIELDAQLASSAVLVPDSAILRSGEKNTVFVALDKGHFEPRTITLGPRSADNYYQVVSGLKAGERVVVSGQFMLDSESQLREAIQKMTEPAGTTRTEDSHADHETNAPASSSEDLSKIVYICPMPDHVSIEYDKPGKCPLCGMTLVPVSQALLAKIRPGGTVDYYTCPMPEDSVVHESKPGKCPLCGMTLIPVMKAQPKPASQSQEKVAPTLYTCPMEEHADVVTDQPGKCPKCGMKLVPTTTVEHGKIAEKHWAETHPTNASHQH